MRLAHGFPRLGSTLALEARNAASSCSDPVVSVATGKGLAADGQGRNSACRGLDAARKYPPAGIAGEGPAANSTQG